LFLVLADFCILGVKFDLDHIDAVGLGTLLLAIATACLAATTLKIAKSAEEERELANSALASAQRQSETAEKTLATQIRPLLIEVPPDPSLRDRAYFPGDPKPIRTRVGYVLVQRSTQKIRISVPYRNAGPGVASIQAAYLEQANPRVGFSASDLSKPNVPAGEDVRVSFVFRQDEAHFQTIAAKIDSTDDLLAVVLYQDVSGRQAATTKLAIRYRGSAPTKWEVAFVEVGDPDMGEIPPPGAVAPPPV
jgi:hypothetical protein